jgi:hypothetical protein
MAKNTIPFMLQNDVYSRTVFSSSDATSTKQICESGTEGSYVYEILVTGTNSSSINATFYLSDGTNDTPVKWATIGANQGNLISSPDPLRLVQPAATFIVGRLLDRDQNYYIPLPSGYSLKMSLNTSLSSGQNVVVVVHRKDF